MNEEQQLIVETAKKIFADQCDKPVVDAAEAGEFPEGLWQTLQETGLTLAGISAEAGGAGGEWADALLLIREAGFAAAPIPLAEHLIGASLLAEAGIEIPDGKLSVAIADDEGVAANVAFADVVDHLVVASTDSVGLIVNKDIVWQHSVSIAGESRSSATFNLDEITQQALPGAAEKAHQMGAASRINLMAGALSAVLDLSVRYVCERNQFGRPLAKFQAIQHQLAILAGEVAACQRAADAVLCSQNALDIAIGKARTGEAITQATDISHQVHGAIGYTLEHALNLRTRRLWQWRDEYGREREWQLMLGRALCQQSADELWGQITSLG